MPRKTRIEKDSLGEIGVPQERLWGAQTERSFQHFSISVERMPPELLQVLALVKKGAALVHVELGVLEARLGSAIATAAEEVIAGKHAEEFPLSVWQTGSGTQTNMNMNEVLANRASELLGGGRGLNRLVDPNDHVNRGQSSNDVFSACMNIACTRALRERVMVETALLRDSLDDKAAVFEHVVKVGRTHLQDATPLTLGQEIGGWAAQLEHCHYHLEQALPHLSELALGGTAVGTGLNAHPEYAERVAAWLSRELGWEVVTAPNKFEAQSAHDAIVFAHGALKTLAGALSKIANDVRWLSSGPRCGLGELSIPANEPGSSIMPGKVNPTQCEALAMCCAQVFGNDVAINFSGARGDLQLNVFKPIIAHDFLQSCRLLADGCSSFRRHLVVGLSANEERIREYLDRTLMLVTSLTPHIGYANAGLIAKRALDEGITLREAALASGLVSAEEFDRHVRPENMLGPRRITAP